MAMPSAHLEGVHRRHLHFAFCALLPLEDLGHELHLRIMS